MRVPFADKFYTKDFDQEMLDYVKDKYTFWGYEDYPFTVNEDNIVLRYDGEHFIVTWVVEGNELTKEQFKDKIGMPVKDENIQEQSGVEENALTKDMLKTGMIAEYKSGVTGKIYLIMVLLDTENGDIIAGETWSPLDESVRHIVKVYQPRSNMHFLNDAEGFKAGLNLEGCDLIWERKSTEQLEIDKLQSEVDERLKRINEIKESLK